MTPRHGGGAVPAPYHHHAVGWRCGRCSSTTIHLDYRSGTRQCHHCGESEAIEARCLEATYLPEPPKPILARHCGTCPLCVGKIVTGTRASSIVPLPDELSAAASSGGKWTHALCYKRHRGTLEL